MNMVLSKPPTALMEMVGVVGGASDADAVVRLGDTAPRAAAMSGRRSSSSDGRPTGISGGRACSGAIGKSEGVRRLSNEDGDGVLVLGTDDSDIAGLNAGGLKLRLGLIDVGLAGDAALEAVGGDAEGLFVVLDGVVEQLLLRVGGAGFEVVDSQLACRLSFAVWRSAAGCLRFLARGADSAADAAPEIDLVAEFERELNVAGVCRVGGVEVGPVGGFTLAAAVRCGGDSWCEAGAVVSDLCAASRETGFGGLEALVRCDDLRFQGVQLGVVEDGPPFAAQDGVRGAGGGTPVAVLFVELRGRSPCTTATWE